jgi:hypothetical protein
MYNPQLLGVVIQALKSIDNDRFFVTERGYQGELSTKIINILTQSGLLPNNAIIEQEYQKTMNNHGLKHRPDILLHIPFKAGITTNRRQGNFVAIELKLNTTKTKAKRDIAKLNDYIQILNYPLAIFINVSGTYDFSNVITDERIHCFNIVKNEKALTLTHYFLNNNRIISENL